MNIDMQHSEMKNLSKIENYMEFSDRVYFTKDLVMRNRSVFNLRRIQNNVEFSDRIYLNKELDMRNHKIYNVPNMNFLIHGTYDKSKNSEFVLFYGDIDYLPIIEQMFVIKVRIKIFGDPRSFIFKFNNICQ